MGAFEFGGTIPATLANISTRLSVGTGDNVLIGGFIVTGTRSKESHPAGDWAFAALAGQTRESDARTLRRRGAARLQRRLESDPASGDRRLPTSSRPNDLESAIVATLPANAAYTAIVRGANNTTGVGTDRSLRSRSHGRFQAGQYLAPAALSRPATTSMIGGFIVLGADPQNVIVRAIGPSLTAFGVAGALQDPTLDLYDSFGTLIVKVE